MSDRLLKAAQQELLSTNYLAYVKHMFRHTHGEKLGDQPYIALFSDYCASFIGGNIKRLLINAPPQHGKSFLGTICLATFLLGQNPRLRILLVAYNDEFAAALARKIRNMMLSSPYRAIFATRLKDGHNRASDFETTLGGSVYAVGATGAVTGRTADVIIYDDPHQISDSRNDSKLEAVCNNFIILVSRLQDKVNGRIIVVAHRVSGNDITAYLLEEGDWTHLALPLVAPRRQVYDLGSDTWVREKGDVLRPTAYTDETIKRLERRQIGPPYELLYQQGLAPPAQQRPRAEHFQRFNVRQRPIAPVVFSVDPSQGAGQNASHSVIQAWTTHNRRNYLLDTFCDHCDPKQQRTMLYSLAKKYRPSVVLIEKNASGPSLYSDIRQRAPFEIKLIVPKGSKAERLARHFDKIARRRIYLPDNAPWAEAFVHEVVHFPDEYDDQVDAMTQFLDFMDSSPVIKPRPPRETGAGIALGSHNPYLSTLWRR